jgi:hypothetical protein
VAAYTEEEADDEVFERDFRLLHEVRREQKSENDEEEKNASCTLVQKLCCEIKGESHKHLGHSIQYRSSWLFNMQYLCKNKIYTLL